MKVFIRVLAYNQLLLLFSSPEKGGGGLHVLLTKRNFDNSGSK